MSAGCGMSRGALLAAFMLAAGSAVATTDTSGGGSWEIDWWTVDGGGEMATEGGGWELSGTLGQWDASENAPLQGGAWELTGGFWGVNLETDVIFKDGFEGPAPGTPGSATAGEKR